MHYVIFLQLMLKCNYIKKAVPVAMLAILLLVHGIKLFHSHAANGFFHDDKSSVCDSGSIASSECKICAYQLSKDADHSLHIQNDNPGAELIIHEPELVSFHKLSVRNVFENRGPPSVI